MAVLVISAWAAYNYIYLPATERLPSTGQFCGGIAGIACPVGYECKLDGNYPDAGGTCIKAN